MLRNGLARPRMRRSPLRHRSGYSTPIGSPRLRRMRSILLKQQHLMLRSAPLEYLGVTPALSWATSDSAISDGRY